MSKLQVFLLMSAMTLPACHDANTAPPMTQSSAPAAEPASTAPPPAPMPQADQTAGASAEAPPVPGEKWHVMTFNCDQLIGLSDDDRAAAMMFYYGYLAARARFVEIDASQIEGNVRRVIDRCAKKRKLTVVEAFREELGPHRVKTTAD